MEELSHTGLTPRSFPILGVLHHQSSLLRFGSAIVADQLQPIPFLSKVPNNPLCFLIYSNRSALPQDQEVFHSNKILIMPTYIYECLKECSLPLSSGIPLLHQQHCTSGVSPVPPVHGTLLLLWFRGILTSLDDIN